MSILNSLILFCLGLTFSLQSEQLQTERLTVSVTKYLQGNNLDLIFTFKPKLGHHLYWWNSGDSGQSINFSVGFDEQPTKIYPILLSAPKKLTKSIVTDYILDGEFYSVLSFDFPSTPERVKIKLDYLICEEVCVPETIEGEFNLKDIPNKESTQLIQELSFTSQLTSEISVMESENTIFRVAEGSVYFFPIGLTPDRVQQFDGGVSVASRFRDLKGLLAWEKESSTQYFKIGEWNVYPTVSNDYRSLNTGFLASLGLAVLSGVILNFMPCVLPVLALKAVRTITAKSAIEDLGYLIGATGTLLVLGMLTTGIFISADEFGWGFQFQNPYFVAVVNFLLITATFMFFGLLRAPTIMSTPVQAKNKLLNQLGLGVFVTLIAIPCGAPFLVPVLATSGQRSGVENLIIFTVMGLTFGGFYILVERSRFFGRFLKFIQRNYATAKLVLAAPIVGTVFWLLYINERQGLLVTFLLVAYALALSGIALFQNKRFGLGVLAFAFSGYFMLNTNPTSAVSITQEHGVTWLEYSERLIQDLQTEGKNYYLDFTADWCVTCKLNKFVVFSDTSLVEELKKAGFVFVKADWTTKSEEVSRGLKKRGQKAIPVTVIFTPAKGEVILPTILLPSIVRRYALE